MARPRNTSRITPKGTRPQASTVHQHASASGSNSAPPSAPWFGWLIVALLAVGTGSIVANYMSWLPGSPSNVWIVVGLAIVLVGILLATRWR